MLPDDENVAGQHLPAVRSNKKRVAIFVATLFVFLVDGPG